MRKINFDHEFRLQRGHCPELESKLFFVENLLFWIDHQKISLYQVIFDNFLTISETLKCHNLISFEARNLQLEYNKLLTFVFYLASKASGSTWYFMHRQPVLFEQ